MVERNPIPAVILMLLSSITIFLALHLLIKIIHEKKFKFVRYELILMIIFEVTVFIKGIVWVSDWRVFIQTGFGKFFAACLFTTSKISLLMLFWNLAFMYYVTSKQLVAWIETMKKDDNPDILLKSFSLKMDAYN